MQPTVVVDVVFLLFFPSVVKAFVVRLFFSLCYLVFVFCVFLLLVFSVDGWMGGENESLRCVRLLPKRDVEQSRKEGKHLAGQGTTKKKSRRTIFTYFASTYPSPEEEE